MEAEVQRGRMSPCVRSKGQKKERQPVQTGAEGIEVVGVLSVGELQTEAGDEEREVTVETDPVDGGRP